MAVIRIPENPSKAGTAELNYSNKRVYPSPRLFEMSVLELVGSKGLEQAVFRRRRHLKDLDPSIRRASLTHRQTLWFEYAVEFFSTGPLSPLCGGSQFVPFRGLLLAVQVALQDSSGLIN